jgi:hypothetical protein
MREIDRRSKIDRRNFLKTAGAVPPAMAVAATTGLSIDGAWADNAQALKPDTMKTLAQLARDIYPHDHLADRYYIAAVTPWDAMATSDAKLKALMEEGIAFLNQSAHAAYKVPYRAVAWEEQRVALLRQIEQTEFFGKVRSDLLVSLYNNHEVWPKWSGWTVLANENRSSHRFLPIMNASTRAPVREGTGLRGGPSQSSTIETPPIRTHDAA